MKLVRNKYFDLFEGNDMRTATETEYKALIRQKLLEEVQEFLESDDPRELADVSEVMELILKDKNLTVSDLHALKQEKINEFGDFSDKVVWLQTK